MNCAASSGSGLSAQAEVGRSPTPLWVGPWRALRAGGGGSKAAAVAALTDKGSPRRRRWVGEPGHPDSPWSGLSAQAEVGRTPQGQSWCRRRALRAGGGGSYASYSSFPITPGSPRRRRWVVAARGLPFSKNGLSAQAEVGRRGGHRVRVRLRALRAGGGGSPAEVLLLERMLGSPRRRRWVECSCRSGRGTGGLSAQAEVGRTCSPGTRISGGALRAGGGGSVGTPAEPLKSAGSPRRRRWVVGDHPGPRADVGLSAQAEVGRRSGGRRGRGRGALRAGGGGSRTISFSRRRAARLSA